ASFAVQVVGRQVEDTPELVPIPRDGRPLPLSFAQQRLWFLHQLQPDGRAYHRPLVVRLRGAIDSTALQQSLTALVARHETLRTTFAVVDEQPVQVIAATVAVPLPVVVVPDLAAAEIETAIEQVIRAEVQQPFDLQQGPLLRATLLRLAECEQILILTLHHIVTDGWSMDVLLRELTILYRGGIQDEVVDLPPLPIQYADYAVWQRQWLAGHHAQRAPGMTPGAVLDQHLGYWRTHLANLPLLDLPTDQPRPSMASDQGAQVTFQLPAGLAVELHLLSQRLDSTLFMTLLAAFQVLLARWSGQQDFAIGTPIAGRARPELEGLIGFFVNTLVLRADLTGRPSFAELVARTRATCLDAYTHQDLPFEVVVEHLQPERNLGRSPLFQVMFVLQNTPRSTIALPDLTVELVDIEHTVAKFDLSCVLTETATGLVAILEYRTDLFEPETIERLAAQFVVLLQAVVVDPQQRIDCLPLLTESEQQQILYDWNATAAPPRAARCVHQTIADQAARVPQALAVVAADGQLTYAELNRRANQLARHLQTLGVEPDCCVGVCIDASWELIVAILGILKAGGAYLPLDPAYPAERLESILTDARAPLLIARRRALPNLPSYQGTILWLDTTWEA
ncbi:MAG TPA: condensation domain-containing protein, partial [Herpetosiphonaceae bacterium]